MEQKKRDALLALWKNVVDSLPAIFIMKNADDNFRYLLANNIFSNLFDRDASEIIGLQEHDFFPNPKDADQVRQDDLLTMELGKRMDFVESVHDKDGILRKFQAVKLPSVNEAGQRIVITMALDITEAMETFEVQRIISYALESLFSSDDLAKDLRSVLKAICEFIGFDSAYICCENEESKSLRLFTTYTPEGEPTMFDINTFRSEHMARLPQYNRPSNSTCNEVFLIDFANTLDLELARYLVPSILEKAEEFDIRGIHLNYVTVAGKMWGAVGFITRGQKIKDLSDNEKRLLNLIAHIVELAITRKRTLLQLKNALKDALSADKAKSFFLSSMSHEIRTPLNAMIGFIDLLKDSELDRETEVEYLTAVFSSSHALLLLLNDILDLSKFTSGKYAIHPVLTNIRDMISEMDMSFRPDAEAKDLKLEFLTSGIPNLYLDQSRMRQILFNLISNAIKFTPKGEIIIAMTYESTEENLGTLTLKVSDTGIGILPEDREALFEPFVQLSRMRGTNASGTGTGLGLAIIKKIVEQEGATLTLQSESGQGSTFTIIWPNIKSSAPVLVNNKALLPLSDDDLPCNSEQISGESYPHVLLVDDSKIVLNILDRMMKWHNISHRVALSPNAALDLLQKESFDIVMTDILMPQMNGDKLAEIIRSDPRYSKIRIIAMSTENESIMYDKSLFDKVILKPIVRNALRDCIFACIEEVSEQTVSGDAQHETK